MNLSCGTMLRRCQCGCVQCLTLYLLKASTLYNTCDVSILHKIIVLCMSSIIIDYI